MWLLHDTDLGLIIAVFSGIAIVIGFTLIRDSLGGYSSYDRSSNLSAGLTALVIGFIGLLCGLSLHNIMELSMSHPAIDSQNVRGYIPDSGFWYYAFPFIAGFIAVTGYVLRDQASHIHGYTDTEMYRMRNTGLTVGVIGGLALLVWGAFALLD